MAGTLRTFVRPLARALRDHVLPKAMPPARAERSLRGDPRSVRVVGLLSSATGLGSSARLCEHELRDAGFDVEPHDVAPLFGKSDALAAQAKAAEIPAAATSIYHLNPPMLLPGILSAGLPAYYRTFNIGYWAWELEQLPEDWVAMLAYLDAVIVPSTFCRDAVVRATDKPVSVVPHPVRVSVPAANDDRSSVFTVLSMFNFGSSFERKNPLASVAAFRRAFGDDAGARLILKTGDGARYPADIARLRRAIEGAGNIEIVDAVLPDAEVAALYSRADAYLSLHRSEGYGLPLAEAMMRGCPVVTTAWSGNLDFCTPDTAMLVPCTLIPFCDPDPAYARVRGGRWADPDIEAAAQHLRALRDDPASAQSLARRARAGLLRHMSENTYAAALHSLRGSGM